MERTDRDQNDRDVEELMEEEEDSTHMERPRLHHVFWFYKSSSLYNGGNVLCMYHLLFQDDFTADAETLRD